MPQQRIKLWCEDSFNEELERVFDKFPKYHTKILLDFNAKVGREDIFTPKIGNDSLYKSSNDNIVRVVNFAHPKISQSKVRYSNIATFINMLGLLQVGNPTIKLTIFR
jgi:hypothetical protein